MAGQGLIQGPLKPIEEAQEEAPAFAQAIETNRAKKWKPQGCFKQRPMTPRERQLKASNSRLWLEFMLCKGPLPAREILQQAKLDGLNEWSLRRAKKRHGVTAVRVGGLAWRGHWVWQFPAQQQV